MSEMTCGNSNLCRIIILSGGRSTCYNFEHEAKIFSLRLLWNQSTECLSRGIFGLYLMGKVKVLDERGFQ
jgi:hypothetical protein